MASKRQYCLYTILFKLSSRFGNFLKVFFRYHPLIFQILIKAAYPPKTLPAKEINLFLIIFSSRTSHSLSCYKFIFDSWSPIQLE